MKKVAFRVNIDGEYSSSGYDYWIVVRVAYLILAVSDALLGSCHKRELIFY